MNYLKNIKLILSQTLVKWFPELKDTESLHSELESLRRNLTPFIALISVPLLVLLSYWILMFATPLMQRFFINLKPEMVIQGFAKDTSQNVPKVILPDVNRVKRLEKAYAKYTTTQPYFVVNTTENSFTLYNRGKTVRQGKCSTGSYILLDAGDEKKWMFETPKGLFRIHGKTESPVWKKPDWAFVEEGLPVPPSYSNLRYEYGVLGDYALSIGNGYLIHGTLYKRLLGMPVTHGCVRMDDDDLEAVYNTMTIGSKVYIF